MLAGWITEGVRRLGLFGDPRRNVAELPAQAENAENDGEQRWQEASDGICRRREKELHASDDQGGAAERRCRDDEEIEVLERDSGAKNPADGSKSDAGETGHHALEAEKRQDRQHDYNAARETDEHAPIVLKVVGNAGGQNRKRDAERDRDHADLTHQPAAEQNSELEAEEAIEERQPRVEHEETKSHDPEAAQNEQDR